MNRCGRAVTPFLNVVMWRDDVLWKTAEKGLTNEKCRAGLTYGVEPSRCAAGSGEVGRVEGKYLGLNQG